MWTTPPYVCLTLLELLVIAQVLQRPHRDPACHIAWVVVIPALPVLGILADVFLGETNIGRKRVVRSREVLVRSEADRWSVCIGHHEALAVQTTQGLTQVTRGSARRRPSSALLLGARRD